jgi:excisionase family DNA binding protein
MEKDEPLWSVDDVSRFLNTKVSTVRAWVNYRRIRFVKIGALVRFFPGQIREDALNGVVGKAIPSVIPSKIRSKFNFG